MKDKPVHLSLGACRYHQFKPGDPVELSDAGMIAGLSNHYAFTVGRVKSFSNGVLIVHREGMDRAQEFHPCFWTPTTEERRREITHAEKLAFYDDHVGYEGLEV